MDIEKLKELQKAVEDKSRIVEIDEDDGEEIIYEIEDKELMWALEECSELIDEAIARQSVTDIGETSDGYHTFNELYEHRTALFATLCNMRSDISWKSMKHDDGTMYDGMFIAGIETTSGQYTYHCNLEYLYMFAYTPEVDKAPPYDGHQPKDYPRLLEMSGNSLYRKPADEAVREAIIRDIQQECIKQDHTQDDVLRYEALSLAITALQQMQGWTIVDLGTYPIDKEVLCLQSCGAMFVGHIELDSGHWFTLNEKMEDPAYWRPLPEPPKGE